MSTVNIKLYDIFRIDLHLSESKARELVETIQQAVKEDVDASKEEYKSLWKDDFAALDTKIDKEIHKLELKVGQTKSELTRAIYTTSFIQFLAVVASVVSLVSFMLRK